jgi:hypothetical protein
VEDRRACDDRDDVGEQCGESCRDKRATALEPHLQEHRSCAVADHHQRGEQHVAGHRGLGGDVAGGERDAGGGPERGAGAHRRTAQSDHDRRGYARAEQPQAEAQP